MFATFHLTTGSVYKGKYKGQTVAIKEPIFRGKGQDGSIGDDDDELFMKEALCMFHEFRQEVTVLAQLDHPNIVALLGVSLRPLCMALEFAPQGSLFDVLEAEVEGLKQEQADVIQVSPVLRMPGGVLGHVMTTKVALQVWGGGTGMGRKCRYGEEVQVWGGGTGIGRRWWYGEEVHVQAWGRGTGMGGGGYMGKRCRYGVEVVVWGGGAGMGRRWWYGEEVQVWGRGTGMGGGGGMGTRYRYGEEVVDATFSLLFFASHTGGSCLRVHSHHRHNLPRLEVG